MGQLWDEAFDAEEQVNAPGQPSGARTPRRDRVNGDPVKRMQSPDQFVGEEMPEKVVDADVSSDSDALDESIVPETSSQNVIDADIVEETGAQNQSLQVWTSLQGVMVDADSSDGGGNGKTPLKESKPKPQILGTVIGKIIAMEHDRSPNFNILHGRLDPGIPTLRPGELVAVESETAQGQASLVIARVANAWEVNPHEDPLSSNLREVINIETDYAPEGLSTVIYRAIESEPLEEIILTEAGEIDVVVEVQSLPRAGAPIMTVLPDAASAALGLQPDPDKGLEIGTLRGSDIPVVLDRGVIQRHIFIGGGIGSGKSYTRGVLAEELQSLGVPQINIDVNGELIEAAQELGGLNLIPGEDFKVPLSALVAEDVINAIPSLNGNMIELVRHAHEELLKETMKTGKHFTVKDLIDKIASVAPELEMKAVTFKPAMGRTSSLFRIKFLGDPYDWETQLVPGAMININCKGMLVSELRIIAASVLRDIQRLALVQKIPFVVISIDEFHLIAPKDENTVTLQVLRELARIGRHYRIGLILTTQSPQDVDRSILKRLLTRFLHAIESDQLDALRGVFSDASEDLIKQLPKLPQGTCIVTGAFETIKHASVVQIRKRRTTHGGATPDIWSDFEERGWVGKRRPPEKDAEEQ